MDIRSFAFIALTTTQQRCRTSLCCRYTDFKVNEIDLAGNVAHLTSLQHHQFDEKVPPFQNYADLQIKGYTRVQTASPALADRPLVLRMSITYAWRILSSINLVNLSGCWGLQVGEQKAEARPSHEQQNGKHAAEPSNGNQQPTLER